jgi:uncharacterized membrane-anchored protein YhcB (DUF1043 family)
MPRSSLGCETLYSLATPKLYHDNAFRILGVNVEASARKIAQRVTEIEMLASFESSELPKSALSRQPPPTPDDIRNAARRLRDPEKRLIDELFWFWPEKSGAFDADASMEALSRGEEQKAAELWATREGDPARAPIAIHNLAVVYHLVALDWENYSERHSVDEERRKEIDRSWMESINRWKQLFDEDFIWDRLRERVEHFSDHALTSEFVARTRAALPSALASINGQLALSYAAKANIELARRHVDSARFIQPDPKNFNTMAETVITPLSKRLREHLARTVDRVAEDVPNTLTFVRELLADAKTVLEFTRLFFSGDEMPNKDLLEEVAVECNRLPKPYFEATKDNVGCLQITELALPFVYSVEARARLERDIKTLTSNIEMEKLKPLVELLTRINEGKQTPASKLEWFLRDAKPLLTTAIAEADHSNESLWEALDFGTIVLRNISLAAWNDHKDIKTAQAANALAWTYANKRELKATIETDKRTLASVAAQRAQQRTKRVMGWLFGGGFILLLIIGGMSSNKQNRSGSTSSATSSASSSYTINSEPYSGARTGTSGGQTSSYKQAQLDSLNSRINSGRSEIAALENRIRSIDGELESAKTQIDSYKQTIEQYELYARSGYVIDQYQYRRVLQDHNALVPVYNARLQERQELYLNYKQLIEQDHALVQEYNSLTNQR